MGNVMEVALPIIIEVLELMGIVIVAFSGFYAFWLYLQNTFNKKQYQLQFYFANGMAIGLQFKMAAEIIKTVVVRDMSELLVLGAVILLRAFLSLVIHFEMKSSHVKTMQEIQEKTALEE